MDTTNTSGILVDSIGYVTVNGSEGQGNMSREYPSMGPLLYQYVYVTLLNALVFIVGISGNILVIQVVVRIRSMWKRMNFFLVSLSVADLQLLIVGLPVAVLEFYSKERWFIGETMCRLVPFLENASHHCSVLTLLVIGFERYYAICHPLRDTARSRVMSPSLLIPITWTLSCVVASPQALVRNIQQSTFYDGSIVDLCFIDNNVPYLKAYMLFTFTVFLVLPLMILTVLYTTIIVTLENSTKNCSTHLTTSGSASTNHASKTAPNGNHSFAHSDKRRHRNKDMVDQQNMRIIACRRQVIRMMIAVMALYFLCLVPMKSYQIWSLLAPTEDIESLGLEGWINLVYIVRMLIYLNCAGNPIIYGLVSANFRNAFKQSMTCRKSDRKDGHRYNAVFYNNTNKRRSTNAPDVIGTPTEQSPCRRHRDSVTNHVMSGVDLGGSRHSLDSKKSYSVALRDHVTNDVDLNGVMSTEVVMDLHDTVYRKINGSTANTTDTRSFV